MSSEINTNQHSWAATIRPNAWLFIARLQNLPSCRDPHQMTKLRLVLLATTALPALQFASTAAHAQSAPMQSAPMVVAQQQDETKGHEKEKGAPPKGGQPPAKGAPGAPQAPHPTAPPPPQAPHPAAPPPQPPHPAAPP